MAIHSFHIPVMGTGFTIDTPLKVARYGISSVISIGDDKLIEKMRGYYCRLYGEGYRPIAEGEEDHRARRITAYLNLVNTIVNRQLEELRAMPFSAPEIRRYFELLDDAGRLKQDYLEMLRIKDPSERSIRQEHLRSQMAAGTVDVNIMTKADRENAAAGRPLPKEYSDAMAALRGYARSAAASSVVFSAGLNLHLYGYAGEFEDFHPDRLGRMAKKVTLKVSDFRSASVQAKILAKKGVWISEYRIESGLNCGGHAFPTDGHLLGPILEEFKQKKAELIRSLFGVYREALAAKRRVLPSQPPPVRLTAQGGVGTMAEHRFLLRYFELDSVGWGSPFLLVPEATAVDDDTLAKLSKAGEDDIYLSGASPLGVPFYNLRDSASEEARRRRICSGKPGSACFSKYLAFDTEYGAPLCVASSAYQARKLADLKKQGLSAEEFVEKSEKVLEKSCICRDLGDGALLKYGLDDGKKELTPAVCPGPNLAYFSKIASLKEMVGHVYGKMSLLNPSIPRAHVFIAELKLYLNYLKAQISKSEILNDKRIEYLAEFKKNLFGGIDYYGKMASQLKEESKESVEKFLSDLSSLKLELESLVLPDLSPAVLR